MFTFGSFCNLLPSPLLSSSLILGANATDYPRCMTVGRWAKVPAGDVFLPSLLYLPILICIPRCRSTHHRFALDIPSSLTMYVVIQLSRLFIASWMLPPRRALCCCRHWRRFWICAVANAWLGLAFGNPLRFLCYLRFAKPRYTERILRWQQRLAFHTFHLLRDYVCLRVYLANITIHFALDLLMESFTHYFNWPLPFVNYFLFNHILPNFPVSPFLCTTNSSRSGVGAFHLDFTKALYLKNVLLASSHSGVGAFRCDFTRALFLATCAI